MKITFIIFKEAIDYVWYNRIAPLFVIFYWDKDEMLDTLHKHKFFMDYTTKYINREMNSEYHNVKQKIKTLVKHLTSEKFVRYKHIVSVTYDYNVSNILFNRGHKKLYCTVDVSRNLRNFNKDNVSIKDIELYLNSLDGIRSYEKIYSCNIHKCCDNGWIYWETSFFVGSLGKINGHSFLLNIGEYDKLRSAKVLLDKEIIICGYKHRKKDFIERLHYIIDM
jgi:hypothetical protein